MLLECGCLTGTQVAQRLADESDEDVMNAMQRLNGAQWIQTVKEDHFRTRLDMNFAREDKEVENMDGEALVNSTRTKSRRKAADATFDPAASAGQACKSYFRFNLLFL